MKEFVTLQTAYEIAKEIAREEIKSEEFNSATKTLLYLNLFKELESQGVPKEKVVSEAHKIIEESLQKIRKDESIRFISDSLFYRVARNNGYSNSVLVHSENSSDFVRELTGEHIKDREKDIKFQLDIIEQAKANITTLQESFYYDLDEHGNEIEIKLDWSDYYKLDGLSELKKTLMDIFYNSKKEFEQMRDARQSILPRSRFVITALTSVVTNKDLCANYYAKVKSIVSITPKKLTGFLNDLFTFGKMSGETHHSRSQLFDLFKDNASDWYFLDIPCPECKQKNLRIKMFENGTWKFYCKNSDYHHQDEAYFPATLFTDRLNLLESNRGGASDSYLTKKGITVKDN